MWIILKAAGLDRRPTTVRTGLRQFNMVASPNGGYFV
jgi:hypothetical protein